MDLESAICRQVSHEIVDEYWFPADMRGKPALRAIEVCLGCPLLEACERLVAHDEKGLPESGRFGIFAAMAPRERWLRDSSPKGIRQSNGVLAA